MNSPKNRRLDSDFKPKITVVGVGGGGSNAVNNMIRAQLEGVEFVAMNTDYQSLSQSLTDVDRRVQLGLELTKGLGAGSTPDVGRAAAEETLDDINMQIANSHMVFVAAGMGGGTGTGAASVVARSAREKGMLTVGVVTKPFHFEGSHRMKAAERGIEELQKYVDTLIVIPNQNLFRIANEQTTFADAFRMADDVLYAGVRGITDLMMMPGLINLDFADVRTVMREMGKAMMGTGEAENEGRAIAAAEAAISNPLLDDVSMKGARGVLISVIGGMDMTLYEVDEAANRIREEVDPDANIIFGSTFDERLNGRIRVSVVATGIDAASMPPKAKAAMINPMARPGAAQSPQPATALNPDPKHLRVIAGQPQNPGMGYTSHNAPLGSTPADDTPRAFDDLPLLDDTLADDDDRFGGGDDQYAEPVEKMGFFSRLLGRRATPAPSRPRPTFAKPQNPDLSFLDRDTSASEPTPTTVASRENKGSPLDTQGDELDIPAFMRRNQ